MRKRIGLFLVFLLLFIPSLLAVETGIYNLVNQKRSPFSSVAYYSSVQDSYVNPASLPLIEDAVTFDVGVYVYDNLNGDVFRLESLGYVQNQIQETRLSFLSKYISLSAFIGTSFTDRHFESGGIDPVFDIYSNIDISIDAGYAFPYFSMGVNIRGGNSMVRDSKTISTLAGVFQNAWLSSFDEAYNSERFGFGAGLLFYTNNFSFGAYVENILNLKNGMINASWDVIASSSSASIAVNGNKFNKKGDLNLVYPRASYTLKGFHTKSVVDEVSLKFDLKFQFLPKASLSIGFGYSQPNHKLLYYDFKSGEAQLFLKGEWENFNIVFGLSADIGTWNDFAPTIIFSFTN